MKVFIFIAFLFPTMLFAQQTYVPDDNFEQALIDLGYDEGPLDDFVPTANIDTVTGIDLTEKGINSIEGILDFDSLISLHCTNNFLTQIDISKLDSLEHFDCADNLITELDVTMLKKIDYINCSGNLLTSLDLSKNPNWSIINCAFNKLHQLNVRNGNNTLIWKMIALGNKNLGCIQVDDPDYSNSLPYYWVIDSHSHYSRDCRYTDVHVEPIPTFSISPNPATDFINIETESLSEEIEIYNMLGIPVLKAIGSGRIDVSDLPRGVYFVKVGERVDKVVLY